MTAKQFEEMFPSLANAEAFTVGGRRFVSMDNVLEIIGEKNKRIYTEHKNLGKWERGYTDALDELESAVEELRGGNDGM